MPVNILNNLEKGKFFILCVSLFLIPLCGALLVEPVIPAIGKDLKTVKEYLVIVAILLFIAANHFSKPATARPAFNIPLHLLIVYLPLSIFSSPPLMVMFGYRNMAGLWMWEGMAWVFLYYFFYLSMIQNDFSDKHGLVAKVISWAAIISSTYAFIQLLGLDQYQGVKSYSEIGKPVAKEITSMIGNPTYLGVWLAMCLPFCVLFIRWWWPAALVFGAILICRSDFATAGAILTLILLGAFKSGKTIWFKIIFSFGLVAIIAIWSFWGQIRPKIHDNSRFQLWADVIKDWREPPIKQPVVEGMTEIQKREVNLLNQKSYPLTGMGINSFGYVFSLKNSSKWESVHNEPLEILYSIGLYGFIIFYSAVGFVLIKTFRIAFQEPFYMACYVAFCVILFCSIGIPLWHIEPLRYFSAVIFCFLSRVILSPTLSY